MKAWTARDIKNLRQRGTPAWYEIKNQADVATGATVVNIFDEIGGWGIYAEDFIRDISGIDGPIDLHISSDGGEVFQGLNIYNAIKQRGGVTVYVDALAASIASVIAMAGDNVVIAKTASLMIHDAAGLAMGNAKDLRDLADILDTQSDNIAGIYADKAGGTVEDWRAVMQETCWYTAQEAMDAGLADSIQGEAAKPSSPRTSNRAGALVNTAVAVHHTDTVDSPWDGGAAEKNLPLPLTVATAKKVYAWYDAAQAEGGEIPKGACSFPHHEVSSDGSPGAANLAGVRNAMARLTQSNVPASDYDAIRAHLQAHLDDATDAESTSNRYQAETLSAVFDPDQLRRWVEEAVQ